MSAVRALVLLVVCVLTGCTAAPLVKYAPIKGPDNNGLARFQLAESMINFSYAKTSAGIETKNITVASVPIPYGDNVYGIAGTTAWENWGVSTIVNASYRGDSTLIQQISVVVTDQRTQAIQAVGSILGAAGGLFSLAADDRPAQLPKGISVTSLLDNVAALGCAGKRDEPVTCKALKLDGTDDFTADISITKVPIDALPASILDKAISSSNFYYSACRQMTISLNPVNKALGGVSATLAVADPHFVETIGIPPKGTITVAASCGANSAAQDPGLPGTLDLINTLATQAKAVKQAYAPSGSSGTSAAKK